MIVKNNISASAALKKLAGGNKIYLEAKTNGSDISEGIRKDTTLNGQHPYAIIVTCSDSRVIPEHIFSAGIGELFVIRVAGNVIDDHQLGSIEYAADHLGTKLVLVLGHTHCGAVEATIHHDPDGYIKFITDEIKLAIGEETDDIKACELNVRRSVELIENNLDIQKMEHDDGLRVVGGVYDIESGKVEII